MFLAVTSYVHSEQWSHRASSHDTAKIARSAPDGALHFTHHGSRSCALCLGLAQARTGLQHPVCLRCARAVPAALALEVGAPDPLPGSPDVAIPRTRAPPASA